LARLLLRQPPHCPYCGSSSWLSVGVEIDFIDTSLPQGAAIDEQLDTGHIAISSVLPTLVQRSLPIFRGVSSCV
jgi:hypothetical protein